MAGNPLFFWDFPLVISQWTQSLSASQCQAITDGKFKPPVALFEKGHPALELIGLPIGWCLAGLVIFLSPAPLE